MFPSTLLSPEYKYLACTMLGSIPVSNLSTPKGHQHDRCGHQSQLLLDYSKSGKWSPLPNPKTNGEGS